MTFPASVVRRVISAVAIGSAEVPDTSVGLLIADGELRDVLKPGFDRASKVIE